VHWPEGGFVGGYLLMIISLWMLGRANPHRIDCGFRIVMMSPR
jgi:hypothetical protein